MRARIAPSILAAALILLLWGGLAYGFYAGVTSHALGANDFYSRWAGAQAMFVRGMDPYSDQVTRDIQMGMLGRLAQPGEDQVAFAYPLYAAFLVAPLVSLPYAAAQAIWMAGLTLGVVAALALLARSLDLRLRPFYMSVLVLSVLLSYPVVRGIFLGQFALVSFLLVAASWYALGRKQDFAAGVLLALATVKPQPIVLILPAICLWALLARRVHLLIGVGITLTALVAASFAFVGDWPLEFGKAVVSYGGYTRIGAPVQTLSEIALPPAWSLAGTIVLALLWFGILAGAWMQARALLWFEFRSTAALAALVTTWIAGRVGTPDQVLLLLPWLLWVSKWVNDGRAAFAFFAMTAWVMIPWAIFGMTRVEATENAVVTLVLPVLAATVSLIQVPYRNRLVPARE